MESATEAALPAPSCGAWLARAPAALPRCPWRVATRWTVVTKTLDWTVVTKTVGWTVVTQALDWTDRC